MTPAGPDHPRNPVAGTRSPAPVNSSMSADLPEARPVRQVAVIVPQGFVAAVLCTQALIVVLLALVLAVVL